MGIGIDLTAIAATFVREQTEAIVGRENNLETQDRVSRRQRGARLFLLLLDKIGLLLLSALRG